MNNNKKKIALIVISIIVVLVIGIMITDKISDTGKINQVKRVCFSNEYEISTEDAFRSYFANEKWKCFKASTGEDVVEFSGKMMYDGEKVNARLQFIIDEDGISLGAFSLNDIAQNTFMRNIVISDIYETYAMNNGIAAISTEESEEEDTEESIESKEEEEEEEEEEEDTEESIESESEEEMVVDAEEELVDVEAIKSAEVIDDREYSFAEDGFAMTIFVNWTTEWKDQGYLEVFATQHDESGNITDSFESKMVFINDEEGVSYLYDKDGRQNGKLFYEDFVDSHYELVIYDEGSETRLTEAGAY